MRTMPRWWPLCFIFGLGGCVGDDNSRDPFALRNPFLRAEPGFDPAKAPAATTQAATRVHAVGNAVIAANGGENRNKPVFFTVGVKEPLIFHRNKHEVILSEGLVERCTTDAELAAAICHELAKMPRAGQASGGRSDESPPPRTRLAPDVIGNGYAPDMTGAAADAMFDRRFQRTSVGNRETRPDTGTIARSMLTKAGHSAEDLERIEPLLREAEENAADRDILRGR